MSPHTHTAVGRCLMIVVVVQNALQHVGNGLSVCGLEHPHWVCGEGALHLKPSVEGTSDERVAHASIHKLVLRDAPVTRAVELTHDTDDHCGGGVCCFLRTQQHVHDFVGIQVTVAVDVV